MKSLPAGMAGLGVKTVIVIHGQGGDSEERHEVEAHIQPDTGFFPVDAPIYEVS